MGKVNHHITLLDPKNVADMLKDVASSVAAKQALVAQRQHEADEAADDLKRATSDNQADAAKKVKEAGDKLKEAQDDLQRLDKNAANTLADAAKASNFDDLKEVPNLCANTTDLCVMPDVCQFRK
ncbi:MAG: hypothetical protein HY268_05280 [Deltaproteobacteria bacterium]|nr:hypothetical protein [Deltaproteobacteria bacterium]